MAIFSFRAECQHDVDQLCQALDSAGVSHSMRIKPVGEFPDREVELETNAALEAIRNAMRGVMDGHVMVQTLRACPLSKNTLERNYDLE